MSRCRSCCAIDQRQRVPPEKQREYDRRRKAQRNERLRRKRLNDRQWAARVDAKRDVYRQLARYGITLDHLFVRDGGVCHICGGDVTRDQAEQDHVLAVVHGGTNDPENVKLSHRSCNRQKSDCLDWRDRDIRPLP